MIRMFVRHNVKDYAAWRKVYDDFEPERGPLGVTGHAVFHAADDPNDVTVWHDFNTSEEAHAFASSEELKSRMQEAGVQGPPTIWFVTEAS